MSLNERRARAASGVLLSLLAASLAWTINTRVDLHYARDRAQDYRRLWLMERTARQADAIGGRLQHAEEVTARMAASGGPRVEPYETRLDLVRRRFAGFVQPADAAPCPVAAAAPAAAPPARADDPAAEPPEPLSERHRALDRAIDDRLARLQGFVRQHMAAYHGVRM